MPYVYTHLVNAIIAKTPIAVHSKWLQLIPELSEDWEDACSSTPPTIANKLIQHYMLHQTPARLHNMHRIPTTVLDVIIQELTLLILCGYAGSWQGIGSRWQIFFPLFYQYLCLAPRACLLGILEEEQRQRYDRTMLKETLFLAQKAIAIKWIQPIPPSVHQWIQMVNQILLHEKLIYEHRGCPKKSNKLWDVWCSSSLTLGSD